MLAIEFQRERVAKVYNSIMYFGRSSFCAGLECRTPFWYCCSCFCSDEHCTYSMLSIQFPLRMQNENISLSSAKGKLAALKPNTKDDNPKCLKI